MDIVFRFNQHRSHAIYLAFGASPEKLRDELLGLPTGCSGGMSGSNAIQAPEINMFGHSGLMGEQLPIAVGAALGSSRGTLAVCGDAAVEEDYIYPSLGFAATKKLKLGTAVAVPWRHPLYMAHLFASLDWLAEGRVIAGMGAGATLFKDEFELVGLGLDDRVDAVKEAVEIMRLAWENDEITYEAYVSEQNLVNDDSDEPIKHPLIEEIFSGKKGSSYFKPSN